MITNSTETSTESDTPLADAFAAAIARRDAAFAVYELPESGRDGPEWDAYSEAYDAAEEARARLAESDEPRVWILREDGQGYSECSASSAEEALDEARGNVDRANYGDAEGTLWIDVSVRCAITGEEACATVQLDEPEPECEDGEDHDWQSPQEIVNGIAENPGVWGKGGGVIIHEVCLRCGCARITDTCAQRPDTGEQGLTSVSYDREMYAEDVAEYMRCAVIDALANIADAKADGDGVRISGYAPDSSDPEYGGNTEPGSAWDTECDRLLDDVREELPAGWSACWSDDDVVITQD